MASEYSDRLLADSFFFAGARAVAVTQWEVFSSSAQQLASGLIADTATSASGGVSAGLRAAMIEYIDQAAEDYLANPRFWGPFIIAGDGAVNPLDMKSRREQHNYGIDLEAERLTPDANDSEFLSMTSAPTGSIVYAAGIERPPPNEKRAGSYLARIDPQNGIEVASRDPSMAAHGVKMLGEDIALSGYFPNQTRSSAVWRFLQSDGEFKWQHLEESEHWDFPVTTIQHKGSYFAISLLARFDNSQNSATLKITKLSGSGEVLTTSDLALSINAAGASDNSVVLTSDGNILIAIGGTRWVSADLRNPLISRTA